MTAAPTGTTKVSIVTHNRRAILERTLAALWETCTEDPLDVLITDNGSTDGTPGYLRELVDSGERPVHIWLLPDNLGSARARNAHWEHCIGHPAVKMDDKVEWLAQGWLKVLSRLSQESHVILGPAYDPTVRPLEVVAPCVPWIPLDGDGGIGGPYLYLPAEVTSALGMWDELPGVIYGWEDVLYIQRARLLGWRYGVSLRTPFCSLAQANPNARLESLAAHPIYERRLRQYREAERDVFIAAGETQED